MKNTLLLLFCFSSALAAYVPPLGSLLGKGSHPRVILTPAIIENAKVRIQGSYAAEYASLKSVLTRTDPVCAAFLAVMERAQGNDPSAYVTMAYNKAIALGDEPFNDGGWFDVEQVGRINSMIGITFDWLYAELTPAQRNELAKRAVRWLDRGLSPRLTDFHQPYHNMYGFAFFGVIINTLAVYNSPEYTLLSTKGASYLDQSKIAIDGHISAVNDVGADGGGWREGWDYSWDGTFGCFPFAMEAWRTATGEDAFAQAVALGALGKHFMHVCRPSDGVVAQYEKMAPGSAVWLPNYGRRGFWRLLASRYRDGYAQHWADIDIAAPNGSIPPWLYASRRGMFQILWHDPAVQAIAPSNLLPTSVLLRGTGVVVMRSGYESKDDVFALFRSRRSGGGNECNAENSFLLDRAGSLLAVRSGYYDGWGSDNNQQYGVHEIASNTIHVDNNFQDYSTSVPDIVFETTADYDFALGDATKAGGSTVTNFTRQFIRLKPEEFFVVYDRIATSSSLKKRWLLHSVTEPAISGSVTGTEVPGHIVNYVGKVSTIVNGNGKLFVNTLLPKQPVVRKVGGAGYEFWVNETGANHPLDFGRAPLMGSWRIEVMSVAPAASENFLHLLVPTTAAVTNPTSQLLEGTGYYGLLTGGRVLIFNSQEAQLTAQTYAVSGIAQTMKHMVCDVKPGRYDVRLNNVSIGTYQANKNALCFTSSQSGTFSISWLSQPAIGPASAPAGADSRSLLFAYHSAGTGSVIIETPHHALTVEIFDLRGRLVRKFVPGQLKEIVWNGDNLSGLRVRSGAYLCNVKTSDGGSRWQKILYMP